MEKASAALVARDYFGAESMAVEALQKAFNGGDFERMARILMPLQEARRQKRDLAYDADHVALVSDLFPTGRELKAGCYLVVPPRVGVDGRLLREAADEKKIPVIVVVREPESRDRLWPIVALGPVTIRTKIEPLKARKTTKTKTDPMPEASLAHGLNIRQTLPDRDWFLHACEAIGDEAIRAVPTDLPAETQVIMLYERLMAHPDHEKLHQRLEQACRLAVKEADDGSSQAVTRLVHDTQDDDDSDD